jgi:hypothetical protein
LLADVLISESCLFVAGILYSYSYWLDICWEPYPPEFMPPG